MFTTMVRKHSSAFTRSLVGCVAGLALLGFSSQEEVSLEEQELLLQLSQQFLEAQQIFIDPTRQNQSIEFFSSIKDSIEDFRRSHGGISSGLAELEQKVLEHRARAYFNAGQMQGASDDFRQLIFTNPRYMLDAEALSPRIVDFFEDLKQSLVGKIAVTSEPAGARVMVGSDFIGITNFFPVDVHTGAHRVEIVLEGYEPVIYEEVNILPGEVESLEVTLFRNSAKLPIITQPSDVEVWVDGEFHEKTGGTLPPDLRSFIQTQFDADQLSAPLYLSALPLGQHIIELKKDCYEPIRYTFNAEEPKDYTALIYKLEDSVAQLQVVSNPPGARVFLDGEYKGNTPLDLNQVCSGSHHLEVKHSTTGKYVEDLTVEKNEALSLECPIRPTMAFLGIMASEEVPARDIGEIREKLTEELQKLEVMNLVFPSPDLLRNLLGGAGISAFVSEDFVDRGGLSPDDVRDLSEKVGDALEVEALLVGYVPEQRLIKDVILNFLAVGSIAPDTYSLNYLDREATASFMTRLSEPTPIFGSWIGLKSIDTLLVEGPIVLRIAADVPAASGGVELGDVVIEVDGSSVGKSLELLSRVRDKQPGESLVLGLTNEGASREVRLEVGQTPVEIPQKQVGTLYNKAIVDLKHRMVVDPSNEPLARLNLALCHMALGDYETALKEHLPNVNFGDRTRGISQGTAYYYQGIAYMKLEEMSEAARMFNQATKYEEATLESDDGPLVAPLARRRLREIGQ